MGAMAWVFIGLIAGWLAAKIIDAPHGLLRNLIVGLVGSLLGVSFASAGTAVLEIRLTAPSPTRRGL